MNEEESQLLTRQQDKNKTTTQLMPLMSGLIPTNTAKLFLTGKLKSVIPRHQANHLGYL